MTLETLRAWSHWLMVATIALPLFGGLAGAVRYLFVQRRVDALVEQQQREESSAVHAELNTAQERVRELEARAAPRALADAQRVALGNQLSAHRGNAIVFKVLVGDTEAEQYAQQLEQVFTESGWTVTSQRAMFMPAFAGLKVGVPAAEVPRDHPAAIVLMALQGARVELARPPVSLGDVPAGEVWLKVSSKH